MAMKVPARDGRPMTSLASLQKSTHTSLLEKTNLEIVEKPCSSGFLFIEKSGASNSAAVIPFVGASFGITQDVQGPLILTKPIHADKAIENTVFPTPCLTVISSTDCALTQNQLYFFGLEMPDSSLCADNRIYCCGLSWVIRHCNGNLKK